MTSDVREAVFVPCHEYRACIKPRNPVGIDQCTVGSRMRRECISLRDKLQTATTRLVLNLNLPTCTLYSPPAPASSSLRRYRQQTCPSGSCPSFKWMEKFFRRALQSSDTLERLENCECRGNHPYNELLLSRGDGSAVARCSGSSAAESRRGCSFETDLCPRPTSTKPYTLQRQLVNVALWC